MGQAWWNSLAIGLVVTGMGLISAWMLRYVNERIRQAEREKEKVEKKAEKLAEEHGHLEKLVNELRTKLTLVEQIATPLNAMMQAALVRELTHFHTPEMDELMALLGPPSTLTDEQEKRLAVLLIARSHDLNGRISEAERDAAIILPIIVKRAKAEAEALKNAPTELKITSVIPEDVGEK